MLGEAYFKLERLEEAEKWYLEALRVKSDHVPAHLTYGKLLARMVSVSYFYEAVILKRKKDLI